MSNLTIQQQLIDKGHELKEAKASVLDQIAANRRSLRDLATQGLIDEDQYVLVLELYPEREGKTPEERLEEAELRAQELREKLSKEQSEISE
jgi:hypothetical protein